MSNESTKVNIGRIFRIVVIIVVALIVGTSIFFFFKTRAESKAALREAKNIRMALRILDIEMYAQEKSVYDPNELDGMTDYVESRVKLLANPEGDFSITSYSYKNHEVTGMTYRKGPYYVVFTNKGSDIEWDVTYMMQIYHFDESDTKIVKK